MEIVDGKRNFQLPGLNYRMTEFQAAIGKVQFEKLPGILLKRKNIAHKYLKKLNGCPHITLPVDDPENTWQTFMVVLDDKCNRTRIIDIMANGGFGCGAGSVSGHVGNLYMESFGYKPSDLPVSAKLDSNGLALPLHNSVSDADVERCTTLLKETLMEIEK